MLLVLAHTSLAGVVGALALLVATIALAAGDRCDPSPLVPLAAGLAVLAGIAGAIGGAVAARRLPCVIPPGTVFSTRARRAWEVALVAASGGLLIVLATLLVTAVWLGSGSECGG
ncbi:MAG: hypothetical protein U0237_19995 [Thermoleophilia bacterium]